MSRRKSFKILPRHTARGDVVKSIEKMIKAQSDKRKSFIRERPIKRKQIDDK